MLHQHAVRTSKERHPKNKSIIELAKSLQQHLQKLQKLSLNTIKVDGYKIQNRRTVCEGENRGNSRSHW